MEETTPAAEEQTRGRKPRKPITRAQTVRNSDLANAGRILPNCPTTAEDIVEQWSIPPSESYGVRVNVLKQSPGDQSPRLMATVPALEYDLPKLAAEFGPGLYFMKGSPSRYAHHSAKFEVSEEYARRAGHGRIPQKAADALAIQTLDRATRGPSDPLELMAAIERLSDRIQAQQSQPAQVSQVQSMEAQANSMMQMLTVMDSMEQRMMAIAERRAGIRPIDEPVPEGNTILEVVKALAPHVGPLLASLGQRSQVPMIPRPATAQPAPQVIQPSHPIQTEKKEGEPAVELTKQEIEAIGPAVRMLRPYSGMLAAVAKDTGKSDQEIAESLSAYLGPATWGTMLSLSEIVRTKGPGVLAHIGPEMMESTRWTSILESLARMIREWIQEAGNGAD